MLRHQAAVRVEHPGGGHHVPRALRRTGLPVLQQVSAHARLSINWVGMGEGETGTVSCNMCACA